MKNSLKKALSDFKRGKFVIVIDDKARENEGDLVIAAEKITPQKVNFMIKQAGGLICVPMTPKRLEELNLPLMTEYNTEFTKYPFSIPLY